MKQTLEEILHKESTKPESSSFLQQSLRWLLNSRTELTATQAYVAAIIYSIDQTLPLVVNQRVTEFERKIALAMEVQRSLGEEWQQLQKTESSSSAGQTQEIERKITATDGKIESWREKIEKQQQWCQDYRQFSPDNGLGRKIHTYIASARVHTNAAALQRLFQATFPHYKEYQEQINQIYDWLKHHLPLPLEDATISQPKGIVSAPKKRLSRAILIAACIAFGTLGKHHESPSQESLQVAARQEATVYNLISSRLNEYRLDCTVQYEDIPADDIEERGLPTAKGSLRYYKGSWTVKAQTVEWMMIYSAMGSTVEGRRIPLEQKTQRFTAQLVPSPTPSYVEIGATRESRVYALLGTKAHFVQAFQKYCVLEGTEQNFRVVKELASSIERQFLSTTELLRTYSLEQLKAGTTIPALYAEGLWQFEVKREFLSPLLNVSYLKKK